jgi:hypothetical protein
MVAARRTNSASASILNSRSRATQSHLPLILPTPAARASTTVPGAPPLPGTNLPLKATRLATTSPSQPLLLRPGRQITTASPLALATPLLLVTWILNALGSTPTATSSHPWLALLSIQAGQSIAAMASIQSLSLPLLRPYLL